MCGLIEAQGFTCEQHQATTDDGYILDMFRIPGKGESILLQHGLVDSSFTWVVNDRNVSLAFVLADSGLDVWMGNNRGNEFGMGHVSLSSKKREFWNWSFDEMGAFDLPALVDTVREISGKDKISYVGHSQGSMQAFIGFSTNPVLASKVKRFYALAPVADVYHSKSPLIDIIAPFGKAILSVLSVFDHGEFIPSKSLFNYLDPLFCKNFGYACELAITSLTGPNMDLDKDRLPLYVTVSPAGTSDQNMAHFVQDKNHRGFRRYKGDAYNLTKITVPTILVSGTLDVLADSKDVNWIVSQLPDETLHEFNVVDSYAHLDFTWGSHANERVYTPYIINDMKRIGLI